ncbi:MAG: hypothetical protein JXR76_15500 [Deltaproteobacteria bacterium]|nr:hypothetical protein [Deltaproteobacteria bacterium]
MNTQNRNSKIRLPILILALCAMAIATAGCDSEETETFDLEVTWSIGGLNVCQQTLPTDQYAQASIEFERIEIRVYEDESKTNPPIQTPTKVLCSAGMAQLNGLPRDTFYISVDAFGNYQGQVIPFFQGTSKVSIPAEGDAVDVPLVVGKGKIIVDWTFAKTCGVTMPGEVDNVAISLDGAAPTIVSCGDGLLTLDKIATNQLHNISAQALDASGNVLYTAKHVLADGITTDFGVLPGQTYSATVNFQ